MNRDRLDALANAWVKKHLTQVRVLVGLLVLFATCAFVFWYAWVNWLDLFIMPRRSFSGLAMGLVAVGALIGWLLWSNVETTPQERE